MTLLSVRNLSKVFGAGGSLFGPKRGVHAVTDVSFDLAAGQTLGLVGESGSGKTTLARCILRLIEPTHGQVLFQSEDILQAPPARLRRLRRDLQVVFQDPYQSLNPRLTVAQIIGEGWRVHPDIVPPARRADRIAELLQSVGLSPDYRDRYPQEFSGGQRQRIGIARALAMEPKLIICDEPVSALDVSVQAQVINLLGDIQARTGVALLFVGHDLGVVRHIARDTAVMYLGRIVEIGPSAQVLTAPAHPYTRALLSAIPIDHPAERGKRQRIRLLGDPPSPAAIPSGCAFRTRCAQAQGICSDRTPELETTARGLPRVACHFPVVVTS